MPRPKRVIAKYPAILAQRDLVFRAAIQIIENCLRQTPLRQQTQILNIYNLRRRNQS
jgi:hypothetical protein